MSTRAVARRARKQHRCLGGYGRVIKPGEIYIQHTEFPGGDAEYATSAGHPVRLEECRDCAEQYGRGHLIAERETNPR